MKIVLMIFFAFSIILSFIMGFFSQHPFPDLFPSEFTFTYIENAFESALFYQSVASSVLVGFLVSVLSTLFGFLLGRGIVRNIMRYKNVWISFFTVPLFFPAVSMFIGMHIIMLRLSIANSLLGVVLSHLFLTIPYAMNIAISYFNGIGKNFESVSLLLGASPVQTFMKILFPLLKDGLILSLQITFLISVSEYFAVFLIGGGTIITLSGVLYPYISNFDSQNVAIYMTVFLITNLLLFSLLRIRAKKTKNLY